MERRGTRARAILLLVLTAICLGRVASYARFATGRYLADSDLSQDYVSGKAWRAGADPYASKIDLYDRHLGADAPRTAQVEAAERNPHPPAFIAFYAPLSAIGLRAARVVVMLVIALAVLLGVFLLCRELGVSRAGSLVAGLVAVALPIVEFDLRWGQSNGLVMLMLVLAWIDLRRGRDARGGAILGAAAALRIFPWMLLIPLLRMRRRRAAGWMLATSAGVTLAGVLALGWDATVHFVRVATPDNFEVWGAAPYSISLVTLPFRLLASGRWLTPGVSVPIAVPVAGFAIVVACATAAARTRGALTGDVFWAAVPWMILGAPLAWLHYLVLLIPLGVVHVVRPMTGERRDRAAIMIALTIVALGDSFVHGVAWITGASLMRFGTVVALTSVVIGAVAFLACRDLTGSPQAIGASPRASSSSR